MIPLFIKDKKIADEMRMKIMYKLHEIEKREKVKVLYAVETASRA